MEKNIPRERSLAKRTMDGATAAPEREREPLPPVQPRADIYETDEGLVVLADLPGVAREGLDVTLERDLLTIEGRPSCSPRRGSRHQEFELRDFRRQFSLSEDLDGERMHATLEQGVLTLRIPKAAGAKPRRVRVKAG